MSQLFQPLNLGGVTLPNRLAVSPMCQYSSADGFANDWHLVHLGSRAVGGAGLVFTEATAVTPEGRISPQDLGLWSDAHVPMLARIVDFLHSQGAVAGIQLAHAGRKASTRVPWEGRGQLAPADGGWQALAPSSLAFSRHDAPPLEMDHDAIAHVRQAFVSAARRALQAGFRVIELHAAHGYLLHEFLSPLSNHRRDAYGGSLENRARLLTEIAHAVRGLGEHFALFVRLSASDWVPKGWDIADSVALARLLKPLGVDLIDCSSGGSSPRQQIPVAPLYQVPFAERIRHEAQIPTGAVGLITTAAEAEGILQAGQADLILMGRQLLREPYFPLHAAAELDVDVDWPVQYQRARG